MSYNISAQQAKTIARAEPIILNETYAIMKQIVVDANAGGYQTIVTDGTTMTESTPTITITGTTINPTITGTPTLIIAGSTITLGTTGLNLNSIIADINDASVSGLVASKNSSNQLVLTYTAPAATTWSVTVGAGTVNTDVGLTAQTYTATNPDSVTYFQVWSGTVSDRGKQDQMKQVIDYFENLGYTIERLTTTATNKTFGWRVSY